MKIQGKVIQGPNYELIVIPRGNGEDIVFKAEAILDMGGFEKLYPAPQPPMVMKPGGIQFKNIEDKAYKADMQRWGKARMAWMIITSLRATEGLEWETVVYEDSSTWNNYETELRASGFSEMEIGRIIGGVMTANSLNEARITEARERFLAGLALTNGQSFLSSELNNTPSGEHVNDSVLSLQR